jgi:acetate CoA/acetoacetate CoA-transferase alpha subunit
MGEKSMSKIASVSEVMKKIKNGHVIMVGGFLKNGHPEILVNALASYNVKDLTIISNDTGTKECAIYNVIKNRQASKIIASYIGANPETGKLLINGEAKVELFPQGTLAEKIRAGGAGLGGFLTPVGVGTVVEQGKEKIKVKDIEYLLETPLKADIALIKAHKADKYGNLVFKGSTRNFNTIMAMAADYVAVEVDEYVDKLDPNIVVVPGILVDAIVRIGD